MLEKHCERNTSSRCLNAADRQAQKRYLSRGRGWEALTFTSHSVGYKIAVAQ